MSSRNVETVSVALCTYNGAAFIGEQVRSILAQSRPPDEIVVSDDASVDETLDIIRRAYENYRRQSSSGSTSLRILKNTISLGVTANFEQALSACSGQLIALCDQDDVWAARRLEILITEFDSRPSLLLLHSDARLVDQNGRPTGGGLFRSLGLRGSELKAVHEGAGLDVLLRRNVVTGATAMVRSSLVVRSRPFPDSWIHDEWLAMVAAATGKIDLLEQPLVDYRQHANNQIGVSALTAGGVWERLIVSRSDRNQRLLARASALAERIAGIQPVVSASTLGKVRAKYSHEIVRSSLPSNRWYRIMPVLREASTGRYTQFGLGLQDVVRDLVQPA